MPMQAKPCNQIKDGNRKTFINILYNKYKLKYVKEDDNLQNMRKCDWNCINCSVLGNVGTFAIFA